MVLVGRKIIIIYNDGEKVARKEGIFIEQNNSGIMIKTGNHEEFISNSHLIRFEVGGR